MDPLLENIVLPLTFRLPDVSEITAPVCTFRSCPHIDVVIENVRPWFEEFSKQYAELFKLLNFFTLEDVAYYVEHAYADSMQERLKDVLLWNIIAFFYDDMSDIGPNIANPKEIKSQVVDATKNGILFNPEARRPTEPLAAANHDVYKSFREKSRPGTFRRLAEGVESWLDNMLKQTQIRANPRNISTEEFMIRRRATSGGYTVWATVEYAADIDLPDDIFSHPTMNAVLDNMTDIATIQNDICSFNKELSVGDGQNLIIILMAERQIELQTAINQAVSMLKERVADYPNLREAIPSFGEENDIQLNRYLDAVASVIQGVARWYYVSPRYTLGLDLSKRGEMIVPILSRKGIKESVDKSKVDDL